MMKHASGLVLIIAFAWGQLCSGDEVTISRNGSEEKLVGSVLVEAQDSGILFQTQDGKIWPLQPDELVSRTKSEELVEPLGREPLGKLIRDELGKEFKLHEAGNFVLVYNTEKAYARWVAGLYRRLNRGFEDYWKRRQFKLLSRPPFYLPVIIFKSQHEYLAYMKRDLGIANPTMLAYYNFETNRVAMYDLTADQRPYGKLDNRKITQVLNNPRAIPMVATVIHEGTHQLMFNFGMQTRFSDTPLWLNEGLAMYFETPDLNATRGWRTIGRVNFLRLGPFLQSLDGRSPSALRAMIERDDGFRDENASNNYCQAWAFCYFLLNKYEDSFVKYLQHMSDKPIMVYDNPDTRIEEFLSFFDLTLDELDREFVQYMRTLKR